MNKEAYANAGDVRLRRKLSWTLRAIVATCYRNHGDIDRWVGPRKEDVSRLIISILE